MNLGKAKDHFSEYYEGTLDRGLKQTFETRFKEDAQLQAEYRAFERTMADLEAFGRIEVEPPTDLHEKISARLDRALWEQKQTQKSSIFSAGWLRALVVGSVAVAGIAVVFLGLNVSHNLGGTQNAGFIGGVGQTERFTYQSTNRGILLSYPPVNNRTIVIRGVDGNEFGRYDLNGQAMTNKPLINEADVPQLLSVSLENPNTDPMFVALPGKTKQSATSGKGSLKELALALSGYYQQPVVLEVSAANSDKTVSWSFGTSDLFHSAQDSVQDLRLQVELTKLGVLKISNN